MATELKMPALSPTMEEGTLAKWLVKVGDSVKSGDLLAEIETDKATMEFEAVDEGTITRIVVPEGTDGVKVGALIAEMDGAAERTAPTPSPGTGEGNASAASEGEGGAPPTPPQTPPPPTEAPPPYPAQAAPESPSPVPGEGFILVLRF